MPKKIKLLFIFLAVVAIVSVFSFFDIFSGVRSASISKSLDSLAPAVNDADNDGLSDTDESYWNTDFKNPDTDGDGFLDGEEVASHHDPSIPSPNDGLILSNITQKISNLTIGGILEGSLSPTDPKYNQTLSDVATSIVDEGVSSLNPQKPPTINVVDDSKENQQKYLNDTEAIWQSFLELFIEEINNIDNKIELTNDGGYANPQFVSYFDEQSRKFKELENSLARLNVPNSWINEHTNLYILLSQADLANKAMSNADNDPIKATIALNFLGNIASGFPGVFQQYANRASQNNINGSSIFKLH